MKAGGMIDGLLALTVVIVYAMWLAILPTVGLLWLLGMI